MELTFWTLPIISYFTLKWLFPSVISGIIQRFIKLGKQYAVSLGNGLLLGFKVQTKDSNTVCCSLVQQHPLLVLLEHNASDRRVLTKCDSFFYLCIIFRDSYTVLLCSCLTTICLAPFSFTLTDRRVYKYMCKAQTEKSNTNISCSPPTIQTLLICLHDHASMLAHLYAFYKHTVHITVINHESILHCCSHNYAIIQHRRGKGNEAWAAKTFWQHSISQHMRHVIFTSALKGTV